MKSPMLIIRIILAMLMMISVFVCWIHSVKQKNVSGNSVRRLVLGACFVFAFCLLTGSFYQKNKLVESVRTELHQAIERLRYGADSEGGMLCLRAEKAATLYLRGRVGVAYQDSKWSETLPETDKAYDGMIEYLTAHHFYPQNQIASAIRSAEYEANEITIQNRNLSRKYMYIPEAVGLEEMQSDSHQLLDPDRLLPASFRGDETYQFTALGLQGRDEYELAPEEQMTAEEQKCEEIYRSYVYQYYLNIPDDVRKAFDRAPLEMVGGTSQLEVLHSVRSYLKNEEDLNSEAYATKAVLLLRYCNIPARYVEGYRVEYTQPGSKQIVTGRDRHQWAEVYIDGVGFATFETDPAYFAGATDAVKEENGPAALQAEEKDTVTGSPNRKEKWNLSLIITAPFILIILWVIYLKIKKKKRLYSKNMMEFTSFQCIRLEKLLKYDNLIIDIRRPYAYQGKIQERYGRELYLAYIRFIHYTDEVCFNERLLSEREQHEMREILKQFERYVSKQLPPLRRIWIGR
ncbi:MAG: transglutaminase-like domain-containing protein [Hespellia sp.]|nr:transglutaminase-like domain-containing protein [Hespellia sp.]